MSVRVGRVFRSATRMTSAARRLARTHARGARVLVHTLAVPRAPARSGVFVDETALGGRAATIMRPRTTPPWPTVLFANGATPDGRAHPVVRRVGVALANAGCLVYVPDLPDIAGGELSPRALAAAVDCATLAADSPECIDGRLGLVGVSIGGTLALLVAAAPELSSRVSVVSCIAPYTDLRKVMLLATTGMYPGPRGLEPYAVPSSLVVGLARSITSILPPSADARALRATLQGDASGVDGLASLRKQSSTPLGPATAAVRELLLNRDPERFDDLYAALPVGVRESVELLSPVHSATRLRAPIELATAPRDKYFPLGESLALQQAARNVRVTVTPALAHAVPTLSLTRLAGLGRLHAFVVRSLSAASDRPLS